MNEGKRIFKKIFIATVWLAIFSGIGTGMYFLFRPAPVPPPPPPPVVSPIETIWSQAFDSGSGLFAAGAKVKNPNTEYGAKSFQYTFRFYTTGNILANSVSGVSFIWPGESKYLIEGNVELMNAPEKVELEIENIDWQEIKNFKGIDLSVGNISHGKGKSGTGKFYNIDFTTTNGTSYDLEKVYVSAVIYDKNDRPIAVNFTVLDNLKSKERRQYSFPWFSEFSGTPNRVDLGATTNIWDRPELIK